MDSVKYSLVDMLTPVSACSWTLRIFGQPAAQEHSVHDVYHWHSHAAGVYVALKVGHPVEDEDDPDYKVHLTEWYSYQRLGAVMNEVHDIQQFGIAEGEREWCWYCLSLLSDMLPSCISFC